MKSESEGLKDWARQRQKKDTIHFFPTGCDSNRVGPVKTFWNSYSSLSTAMLLLPPVSTQQLVCWSVPPPVLSRDTPLQTQRSYSSAPSVKDICAQMGSVAAVSVLYTADLHGHSWQDAKDALLLPSVATVELYPHRRKDEAEVRGSLVKTLPLWLSRNLLYWEKQKLVESPAWPGPEKAAGPTHAGSRALHCWSEALQSPVLHISI